MTSPFGGFGHMIMLGIPRKSDLDEMPSEIALAMAGHTSYWDVPGGVQIYFCSKRDDIIITFDGSKPGFVKIPITKEVMQYFIDNIDPLIRIHDEHCNKAEDTERALYRRTLRAQAQGVLSGTAPEVPSLADLHACRELIGRAVTRIVAELHDFVERWSPSA